MDTSRIRELLGFYENELVRNVLFFWDEKCLDAENGGFLNCFDNTGENLISKDKYTWSLGRFVWLFARLADMECGTLTKAERAKYLAWAGQGADFLMAHSLVAPGVWRCAFLLDETGAPKTVEGWGERLDLSLAADSFVVSGLARYAKSANREDCYVFAKALYLSAKERYKRNDFVNLPYPLGEKYRAHGGPMIFLNAGTELYGAAQIFDTVFTNEIKTQLRGFAEEILYTFTDENHCVREVIAADGSYLPSLLGQHMNPGHTIECMWFLTDAMDIFDEPKWLKRIATIAWKALECGWDEDYGGLLHYCGLDGGAPKGDDVSSNENEPMTKHVLDGWADKLWWVHSEALYTTLLLYARTEDELFWEWHRRVFAYTFDKFPNPNREVREWIQILQRDGTPQEKVVALPVKDPYHIARNLLLIIELLHAMLHGENS